MVQYAWLIPLLPAVAFVLIIFLGRRLPGEGAYVAIGAIALSALLALGVFVQVLGGARYETLLSWAPIGERSIEVGFLIDPLASMMLVLVGVIATLIQIYSIGYMHGDPRYPRFFAYLSLFSGSMLLLTIANNFLVIYVAWELVGLCSYLLIGFWFERPAAARASLKAFLVTRVGDFFMFLGILLLFFTLGTLHFGTIFEKVEAGELAGPLLTLAAILVYGGAVGKSAQIPLHVWLPDAMEGPTPVSALIHSATMVAAGVYLVARTYPIFFHAPDALRTVALIGALTALMAATIGIAQDDIKRVLAYSTISQLGYMMLGLGVLGYSAGVFHMMTQAVFKSLLFLAAGSVIHAMHTNDIKEMGGLRETMPITYWTFLIGGLALAGIPPFAGFWSKDEILLEAFHRDKVLFALGLVAAFFTSFYIFRVIFYTFFGQQRTHTAHPHESPPVMTIPLVILATGATFIGFVGAPFLGSPFQHFIHFEGAGEPAVDVLLMAVSVGVGLLGVLAAALLYYWRVLSSETLKQRLRPLYLLVKNKYYWDEFYLAVIVKPGLALAKLLFRFDLGVIDGIVNAVGYLFVILSRLYRIFDLYVVDGIVNLVGWVTKTVGSALRYIQTGRAENYLLAIALGVLVLVMVGVFR
ncbi:MAG: NADH-quinone oxidoreductase subunit L [Armatimonadota bacterium]|nr:NADH-quinone oxidoreductase subunit L [Armatimonadota bacterium]MDR5703434.1 NADH-quinone oxidoreductase subunit L [Armatimonadota bacterium]MDR7434424.1 NADH-quinone oxidoreductase subunit L [Armatimonadota bacterium]